MVSLHRNVWKWEFKNTLSWRKVSQQKKLKTFEKSNLLEKNGFYRRPSKKVLRRENLELEQT